MEYTKKKEKERERTQTLSHREVFVDMLMSDVCVRVLGHAAASVGVLVAIGRRRLLQEGGERGADGAAAQRLLHTEVVHHALLHLLLS